jgi:hypothetical protein
VPEKWSGKALVEAAEGAAEAVVAVDEAVVVVVEEAAHSGRA